MPQPNPDVRMTIAYDEADRAEANEAFRAREAYCRQQAQAEPDPVMRAYWTDKAVRCDRMVIDLYRAYTTAPLVSECVG